MRSPTVPLMAARVTVDVVDVAAAVEFDFVGEFHAIDGAVVVVEDFFVYAADGGGFLDDEMSLRVEENLALHVGGGGDFDLESVFAADLGVTDEGEREFVLLGIEEARIVVAGGSFELVAFLAQECGEFAGGGLVPGGLAVVGFDDVFVAEDEFGVVAVGKFGVESEGGGLSVGGIGEGAFESHGMDFGQGFAAAGRFHILIGDLGGILGLGKSVGAG